LNKAIEYNELIAVRVPVGDNWRLIDDGPEGKIHPSITEALEAWFQKTGEKVEFRLAPLTGKLYVIRTKEMEIKPEPPKKFNIYGDFET
jgi:hypothetical protein